MNRKELIEKVCYKTNLYLKRNSSTLLTIIGASGVVISSVLAAKATPKALKLIEEAEGEKGDKLSKMETFQIAGPAYIPSAAMCMATISCIFGAHILDGRKQSALSSACVLLDNAYREYREKTKEMLGEDADGKIIDAVIDDRVSKHEIPEVPENKTLFYEAVSDRFFESTIEDVQYAEYHFNRNFTLRGYASLNELYDFLGIDRTEYGDELGWDLSAGEVFYGYSWVDFDHVKRIRDDGVEYYILSMPFGPHPMDEDEYNYDEIRI